MVHEMYSYGPPHMAVQKQDDQHKLTFSSYVRIRDVVLKTYLGRWTKGRNGERGSGISVVRAIWWWWWLSSSPDGDTEYFDIVAGVLQGDTLAPYLFIICLDYVLRTSIDKIRENGIELTKKRRRRYPAKTITDADYADDIAILANTPDQAETLLHS